MFYYDLDGVGTTEIMREIATVGETELKKIYDALGILALLGGIKKLIEPLAKLQRLPL